MSRSRKLSESSELMTDHLFSSILNDGASCMITCECCSCLDDVNTPHNISLFLWTIQVCEVSFFFLNHSNFSFFFWQILTVTYHMLLYMLCSLVMFNSSHVFKKSVQFCIVRYVHEWKTFQTALWPILYVKIAFFFSWSFWCFQCLERFWIYYLFKLLNLLWKCILFNPCKIGFIIETFITFFTHVMRFHVFDFLLWQMTSYLSCAISFWDE